MTTKTKQAAKLTRAKAAAWSFPDDTVQFLRDLKVNNNREWFTANKSRYDLMVKQPAIDFCERMTVELEALTGVAHTSKIFRVNRDIRFSKDKTPYKAYMHILFRPADSDTAPKWFFGLEPDKLHLGTGIFGFEKQDLERFRQRVAGPDGEELGKLIGRLQKKGIRLREPELKKVPSAYPVTHGYPDLLRHKGLTAWIDHPGGPEAAAKPDIVETTIKSLKTLQPLFEWLHIGE